MQPRDALGLREVVGAYSTFANHGVRVEQHLVTRVETLDGAGSEPGLDRPPAGLAIPASQVFAVKERLVCSRSLASFVFTAGRFWSAGILSASGSR